MGYDGGKVRKAGVFACMRSYRSALEAEQQRARIPKDVLALPEANRLKEAEKEEEVSAEQEEEREETLEE